MKHKYSKGKVLYFINWAEYTHHFKIKSKIKKCTILKRVEVNGFSELWYVVTESGYGYFTIREDHLYETEAEAKKGVLKGLKESLKELDEKYLDLKMRIEDEIKNQSTDGK